MGNGRGVRVGEAVGEAPCEGVADFIGDEGRLMAAGVSFAVDSTAISFGGVLGAAAGTWGAGREAVAVGGRRTEGLGSTTAVRRHRLV